MTDEDYGADDVQEDFEIEEEEDELYELGRGRADAFDEVDILNDDIINDDITEYSNMDKEVESFIEDRSVYKTINQLTKYEKCRLISTRATQIQNGSKPLVKIGKLIDPLEMAELEFENGVIPLCIVRPIPTSVPNKHAREIRPLNTLI
jgi:DNA-directed RNA polymerase subunit K/omega